MNEDLPLEKLREHVDFHAKVRGHLRRTTRQLATTADPVGTVFMWSKNSRSPEAQANSEILSGAVLIWLEDEYGITTKGEDMNLPESAVAALVSLGIMVQQDEQDFVTEQGKKLNLWQMLAVGSITINALFLLATLAMLYLMR